MVQPRDTFSEADVAEFALSINKQQKYGGLSVS
jgi:hypothetical protein